MVVSRDGSRPVPSKRKSMKTNRPVKKSVSEKRGGVAVRSARVSRPTTRSRTGAKAVHAAIKGNGTVAAAKSIAPAPKILGIPSTEPAATGLTEEQLRKVKTGLTRRDLERYRKLLMDKRHEILGDVESLQTDRTNKNTGGNLSNMPLHMADVGSDNYEQEFTLHLVESERKLLHELDEALARIKAGTFGVCLERGVPIAKARLDAKPWAKYCIEVTRERERMGMSVN
jgi:DnaK suppressor protein